MEKRERQLLEIGSRSCRRMIELLDLYLDIAKLDASMMPVDLKPIVLLDEVFVCVEEQESLVKERCVKVVIDVDPDLKVSADRDLLPRVIQNLLNNAVKFSPQDGEVTVAARRQGDGRIVLTVEDRGPGIAADDLLLIFDRFHQAKARQQGKTQGTGLGLTFCREAMRAMHGEIDVDSRPGRGSRFFLIFPPVGEGP
jgi:signal transduction histidine kinase